MRRLILVTPPAFEPIDVQAAAQHMRLDQDVIDQDNALIGQLVTVATGHLDGRDGLLGRALIKQTWTMTLPRFVRAIEILLPPLISIDEISYFDSQGAVQILDLQTITVEGIGDTAPAILRPLSFWPATADRAEAVSITFTAGFGPAPENVPGPIRQALLLYVAHLYENRESTIEGTLTEVPMGFYDLIAPYRLWAF